MHYLTHHVNLSFEVPSIKVNEHCMWSLYSKTFTFFNACLIISLLKKTKTILMQKMILNSEFISKLLTVKAPRYETTPAAIITSPITLYSSLLKMSTDSAHLTFSSAKPPMSCEVTHTCEPVNVNLRRVSAYLRDPFHPNYDYPIFFINYYFWIIR